jgi:clan AA aspartic protease
MHEFGTLGSLFARIGTGTKAFTGRVSHEGRRIKHMRIYSLSKDGFIYANAKVRNPSNPKLSAALEFLVDTGASGCAIPESLAEKLALEQKGLVDVGLADGRSVKAKATYVWLEIGGRSVYTWCIYGEGFEPILGIEIMEGLGFHLDVPERRALLPLRRLRVNALVMENNFHVSDEGWERMLMEGKGKEKCKEKDVGNEKEAE